mgnify:CR=1 FL=1
MTKHLSFIFGLCAIIFFAACDKEETNDDQWKNANEAQFAKMSTNAEYKRINSATTAGYIMYKELKSGNGATPYFTDRVKVLYTGWYKRDWTQPKDTYTDSQGNTIINKIIFDSTNRNIPSEFAVKGLIDGFTTALQHMQVGDKWEVWIPWKLAYGASGYSSGNIPGYTMLVFEIELVSIVE